MKVLLKGYCQGVLERLAIKETLRISKSTYFVVLKDYRRNPDEFSLTYHRETAIRIPARGDKEIDRELMLQRNMIDGITLHATCNCVVVLLMFYGLVSGYL